MNTFNSRRALNIRWIYFFCFAFVLAFAVEKGEGNVSQWIEKWKVQWSSIAPSLEQLGPEQPLLPQQSETQQAIVPSSLPTSTEKGIYGITIDQSSEEVLSLLGAPQRKDPGALGYEWWIYNKDSSSYIQIGIRNQKVVDLYSTGTSWHFKSIGQGSTMESLKKVFTFKPTVSLSYDRAEFKLTNSLDDRPFVIVDGIPTLFYLDKHDQNKVIGIRLISKEWLVKSKLYASEWSYFGTPPNLSVPPLSKEQQILVQNATEKQIFDLVNVFRSNNGLSRLHWNEQAAVVSRGHSLDMLQHQYFDHVSATTGMDPFSRMKKQGIKFRTAGENIAMGYMDAMEVHHGWVNSLGHRKNILNPDFTTLGVGVVSDYSTQNFVTPW